jgi:proteasome lid subunit RPN8/RPN11
LLAILRQDLLNLLDYARSCHPKEIIVLLRGVQDDGGYRVTEFLTPPMSFTGQGFASFRPNILPIDFTVIGTAHSHPVGSTKPSGTDITNFYSKVMLIVAAPYRLGDVAAYNKKEEEIPVKVPENFE